MTSHGPITLRSYILVLSFMQEALDLNRGGNVGMRC
jgi:hypothetical protein